MVKKVLLIIAHPKEKSLNNFLAKRYQELCIEAGHEIKVIDLYKDKFNPLYHSHLDNDPLVKVYQDQILWAEHLVFVHPVWWYDMPAMLKGFFDKVFASKFAFKYVDSKPVGLLQGRTVQFIRTFGGPKIYTYFIGAANVSAVKHAIVGFCGMKWLGNYDLFNTNTKEMSEKKAIEFVESNFKKAIKKI